MFPSREYMIQFFPILERHPYLLVFCWIIRNWRFFRRICGNKCKKAGFRIRVRLLDIQEKMKGMIRRNRDEEVELPEETSGDIVPQAKDEGGTQGQDTEEESGTWGKDAKEERDSQETEPEKEAGDTRNKDAEEDTANIEQTEGDSDV